MLETEFKPFVSHRQEKDTRKQPSPPKLNSEYCRYVHISHKMSQTTTLIIILTINDNKYQLDQEMLWSDMHEIRRLTVA